MCIYIYIYRDVYIYIYRERERDMHTYIYIYRERGIHVYIVFAEVSRRTARLPQDFPPDFSARDFLQENERVGPQDFSAEISGDCHLPFAELWSTEF